MSDHLIGSPVWLITLFGFAALHSGPLFWLAVIAGAAIPALGIGRWKVALFIAANVAGVALARLLKEQSIILHRASA